MTKRPEDMILRTSVMPSPFIPRPVIRAWWDGESQLGIRLYRNDTGRTHSKLHRNAASQHISHSLTYLCSAFTHRDPEL